MKRALLIIDVQNEYFVGKLPVFNPAGSLNNIRREENSHGFSNAQKERT